MSNLDAKVLARQAITLGLLTEPKIEQAWMEFGREGGEVEPFLRLMERKGHLTPWQTGKLVKGDTEGFFLGGYKILYKVASGSFGRVFRAEEPQTGRVVAIKVLRRRWTDDPQRVELFEREGRVGLSLRHPGIVEILTVNHDAPSGQWFIVMEFVEGGNLRDILAIRKKLTPAEALKLIEDAAGGLAHAYARGVTHRDVKLTNILVSSQGTAKLVDFGLAKFYATISEEEDKVERTVDYAGLEKGTGVNVGDVRSDIYFLGCVFYEMLTGRAPLEATRNKLARMHKQRFDNVAPIAPGEVEAPPSVFHLLDTMMALNPKHRYQTPAQLVDAIRAARRDLGDKSVERSPTQSARSVFVAESDERLQDAIRDKLKELGYRVFMAGDPVRALDRFRQQPYDALVVDAGTTGEDGLLTFDRVMSEAERLSLACAGILVLNEDQKDWVKRIRQRSRVTVMIRPVTLKALHKKLQDMIPEGAAAT
jgi:eukaryotic-like serine/threonine-protein kinase